MSENIDSREAFTAAEEAEYNAYFDATEAARENDEYEWDGSRMDDEYEDYYADEDSDIDESMDGDFDSAMRDAGWGTDEDYGYYGDDGGW